MPESFISRNADWLGKAWAASCALVRSHAALRASTLREHGYQFLAQLGQSAELRSRYYPTVVASNGIDLRLVGTGFRAVVYTDGQLLYKINHNLGFEVLREWRQYTQAMGRLLPSNRALTRAFEKSLGLLHFPLTDPLLVEYALDSELAPYFRDEWVLIKEFVDGRTLRELVVDNSVGPLASDNMIEELAGIFRGSAEAGILLQGDPDDVMVRSSGEDAARWVVIDPDGWVCYPRPDAYVHRAARGAFVGTFIRLSQELEGKPAAATAEEFATRVARYADSTWNVEVPAAASPERFRATLAADDLLAPKDPSLSALIRYELQDPLALDSELGRCSLNVLLTSNRLLLRLLELRGLSGSPDLGGLYFGDLGVLRGVTFAVVFNSYNDSENERSGDWAYNHTGVPNEEIAHRLLDAAEARVSARPSETAHSW